MRGSRQRILKMNGQSILLVILLCSQTKGQLGTSKNKVFLACTTDEECISRYGTSTTRCIIETGICSNPFVSGCLFSQLGDDWGEKRICNSDDIIESEDCQVPEFNDYLPESARYPEIRIHNGDRETSVIMAWIYQIVLMELADVPATVGLSTPDTKLASFYNPNQHDLVYSQEAYPWEGIRMGDRTADCSSTIKPCVHFLPEVWVSNDNQWDDLLEDGVVEPLRPNGLLGFSGLYIPLATAKMFPELATWFGWQGEQKRQFLAETFRRPVTWSFYCDNISETKCSVADDTALRRPTSLEEAEQYFAHGFYQGFFYKTERNDCVDSENCSGAVIAPPCDWTAYIESQLYHNNIVGLELDGPLEPNGGYSGSQMREIWQAANATKSHVIMYWFEPDTLPVSFTGTDYEYHSVDFPKPSFECEENRPTTEERCSSKLSDRRGEAAGSCQNSIMSLTYSIVKSIGEEKLSNSEPDQSPAHDLLKNIKISNLDIGLILRSWQEGNDPREAVCGWIADNVEMLNDFVPPGYPREIKMRSDYASWYLRFAQVVSAIIGLLAFAALILCYRYRDTKTMVFTQPVFMMIVLFGFCLVCSGAVLHAMEPTYAICIGSSWLILQGSTIELGAVLVKTAAINELVHSSKKMKRISIRRDVMLVKVFVLVLGVAGALTAWTILDPATAVVSREIIQDNGDIFIRIDSKCASESQAWLLAAFGWQSILLIIAAVLAYQSRSVMEQLNESKSLAMMVYSHFVFVCLRAVAAFFYSFETVPGSAVATIFSLTYSLDAFFAMAIYVFPKIHQARKSPGDYKLGRFSTTSRLSRGFPDSADHDMEFGASIQEAPSLDETGELKILVCSANLGNAEPTIESLEAWIPLGGSCDRVHALNVNTKILGKFDVIAVGMQEATWADSMNSSRRRNNVPHTEQETLTEEQILSALEETNTADLRKMMQETLGEGYYQIADEQRGQMRLHLWAKRAILRDIVGIRTSGTNTGIGNMLANKGGIITTLTFKSTRISFLTAHLAAHEGRSYYKTRCSNIETILREAKTFSITKKFDDALTSHHMFVFGDLNFRTAFDPENKHEENIDMASDLIAAEDYSKLYEYDELQQGLYDQDLLVGFQTLPCNFPPTFKVERRAGFVYKKQRTPSYTDRILFKSAPGLGRNMKSLAYEPCADFVTSDHKPIRGAFSIKLNDSMDDYRVYGDLDIVIRKMRCTDLPAGDSDGYSDPYVMFLWDGVDFSMEDVSFMDKVRMFWMGQSWPRTQYISKTLNPFWKGVKVHLRASNTKIGYNSMLFLAVIDFDLVGKDDLLGGVALNVRDLIRMQPGETKKTVQISRDLVKAGKAAGRIKFTVDISENKKGSSRLLNFGKSFRRSIKDLNRVSFRQPAKVSNV